MKTKKLIIFLIFFTSILKAQYPFEQFDTIKYKTYENWIKFDWSEKKHVLHHTLTIKDFYQNHDSLTIQLSTSTINWDSSYIRIFRNKNEIQKFFEPMPFLGYNFWDPLFVADYNSDSLKDIKLNVSYMSSGLGMSSRIIYLFQTSNNDFKKVSFDDNLKDGNRNERDLDKDGKYEIITMTLNNHRGHNYWTFDLFNYDNGKLINVDEKFDYPIMIQFLNRHNFKITNKINREKMKEFKMNLPQNTDIK